MNTTRLVTMRDAPVLAALLRENREFLAPWQPDRGEAYFTAEGQRETIRHALEGHRAGTSLPHLILDEDGRVVGRITLSGIVRGFFQSCSVGYWVAASENGKGRASAALGEIVRLAFDEMGLHRIQAETLVHNAPSQRVLERNGFVRIGLAPAFLNIAGRWQDHVLYQVVRPEHPTRAM